MKPGQGIVIDPLDSEGKSISLVKAEEGYVYLVVTDEPEQRVVRITLSDETARELATALRKVAS